MKPVSTLSVMLLALTTCCATNAQLNLPDDLVTVVDGRATMHQHCESYGQLLTGGWLLDVIARSQPAPSSVSEQLPENCH